MIDPEVWLSYSLSHLGELLKPCDGDADGDRPVSWFSSRLKRYAIIVLRLRFSSYVTCYVTLQIQVHETNNVRTSSLGSRG